MVRVWERSLSRATPQIVTLTIESPLLADLSRLILSVLSTLSGLTVRRKPVGETLTAFPQPKQLARFISSLSTRRRSPFIRLTRR